MDSFNIEIDQFDFELIPSKFQTFDIFIDEINGLGLCFSTKDKNIVDKYKQAILLYENGKRQYKLDK